MTPFTWRDLPLGEMESPESVRVTSLPWQLARSHDVDAVCWVGGTPWHAPHARADPETSAHAGTTFGGSTSAAP